MKFLLSLFLIILIIQFVKSNELSNIIDNVLSEQETKSVPRGTVKKYFFKFKIEISCYSKCSKS